MHRLRKPTVAFVFAMTLYFNVETPNGQKYDHDKSTIQVYLLNIEYWKHANYTYEY